LDTPREIVARINAAWLAGRFDELRDYFHPDVVLAQPGFAKRTVGREALIASYRDFVNSATIHSFTPGEVQIDDGGDSAVTTMPWEIEYTMEGQRYQEHGWDLLVFGKRDGGWVVVWRTVVMER
jgi:ketosteroid isomerase-like protein